jgi:2-phosphosulfolactate phosphatase
MKRTLEVLFTPADFGALGQRDLSQTICVVFDVLRATSSMVTALANDATGIIPVEDIPEALAHRQERPDVLLAGERDGLRIEAAQTGSIAFDLGNSPREFTRERVGGRTLVMTTTNGTRALRACAPARALLIGSFLNLDALAQYLLAVTPPNLLVVCSGTFEEAAYEDVLGAGALCDRVWQHYEGHAIADSAWMARRLFLLEQPDLVRALAQARNGRRLLSRPDLAADVDFCLKRDSVHLVAEMDRSGLVRVRS